MQMIKRPLPSGRIQPASEEVSELTFPEMGHQGASIPYSADPQAARRLRCSILRFVDRDRYQRETQRLAAILRDEIRSQGVSIRSLEQKMGVGNSVYQKVLGGKITMTVGHLLQIADALGLEWLELFRRAYLGPVPPAEASAGVDELEARVLEILHRHGVLPDAAPEDQDATTRTEPARSAGLDAREDAPGSAALVRSSPR